MNLLDFIAGCTFDDFLLTPQMGVLPSRDPDTVDLSTRFSENIRIKRPIVSANMDTVTRAAMAIVLAEEGGIGVIDRGYRQGDIEPQVTEVVTVKRKQHAVIRDPHTISKDQRVRDGLRKMEETHVGTLVVTDSEGRLIGLLTQRDARFVDDESLISAHMTPKERLIVAQGSVSLPEAEKVMRERKIKKLPLIEAGGKLSGLITAKDLLHHKRHPFATRDREGRLRVAAAVGATGDYLERARELVRAGADALVVDVAHGHSRIMERAVEQLRKVTGTIELIAGNVATADGVKFLLDRGVNGVKVGIGPGGGCTTRLNTNFGVPQVEALVRCRLAANEQVPLIADGGIKRDGNIAQALIFGGDSVMLGSAFAGTEETPGETVLRSVLEPESQKMVRVPFKVFRGMASITAVRDRLDLEEAAPVELAELGAEGLEVSVPSRGSARTVIHNMLKHLCSAISYGGAESLQELRRKFWSNPEQYLIKLSASSKTESFQR
ncbi:MAG TPA: IMP dehydrogenase [Candidatus Sulfotelmatobacter sp.]|nr:IMP dehydrogenase [Candidatus Sulfotelmatobacter sp.]